MISAQPNVSSHVVCTSSTAPDPVAVPTLSELGLLFLGVALALVGVAKARG